MRMFYKEQTHFSTPRKLRSEASLYIAPTFPQIFSRIVLFRNAFTTDQEKQLSHLAGLLFFISKKSKSRREPAKEKIHKGFIKERNFSLALHHPFFVEDSVLDRFSLRTVIAVYNVYQTISSLINRGICHAYACTFIIAFYASLPFPCFSFII